MKTSWTRHLFYRRESLRTTWKLRMSVLVLAIVLVPVTHGFWAPRVARSLMCDEQIHTSDAFLLENFDPDYLVFERTTTLQKSGVATRAFVPVVIDDDSGDPNLIQKGIADLMAGVSRIQSMEIIPIRETEPISLNAARQIRDVLTGGRVKSVIVVSPGFRSRRSMMVYSSVLGPAGITTHCAPVIGTTTADNWTETWHGVQGVVEQFIKLQYYRFWVLR